MVMVVVVVVVMAVVVALRCSCGLVKCNVQDYIWHKGARCESVVTEFQVMCLAVGASALVVLLLFMIVVCFAKKLHVLKTENKKLRKRRPNCCCDFTVEFRDRDRRSIQRLRQTVTTETETETETETKRKDVRSNLKPTRPRTQQLQALHEYFS
ncbi:unnamed protein product [Pleuronectes platessa]|uniref:Uncharacterized protein n=1 Tax=Pleuronectes platessa TaxID=8262 RepID=A0A9N7VLQ1_PLEPL|nr:unnamed protein product [Pleuronectes platessa]